jgi:hypothetical protein
MTKVRLVSAYVDLGLTKRPAPDFHVLGNQLEAAAKGRSRIFRNFPFAECWLPWTFTWNAHPPANPRAEDRFVSELEHVRSNYIQHSPMQWMHTAWEEDHSSDVFVWMGYSILKQGDFTGRRIKPWHVTAFLDHLEEWEPSGVYMPGITEKAPIQPYGDNWRFCGSTIVVPAPHVGPLYEAYKSTAIKFIRAYKAIPLDLAIWSMVEEQYPINWYQAEYDHTQLTNFPC